MADIPELRTRKPTGKPPWPMILLAGAEKCGKSYAAAAFSASDLVDRTFFVELGEGYADHYGEIPGARYEIVEHDGSYVGIGRALRAATMQPRPNGKPHAIILDTATELWDLLSEEAQATANRRKGKDADGEAQITMDLWNVAKKRWRHIVDLLRQYDGPVVITARLEQVAVMSPSGQPTTAKEWKVRAEKNLPFECDAVVKMPEQGKAILTGVRSLLLRTGAGLEVSDFSIEKLLTSMGIRPGQTQARAYTAPRAEQPPQQPQPDEGRPMQRSTGTPPEQDPWATPAPATPPPAAPTPAPEQPARAEEPEAPRESTHAQRTKLVILVKEKRGIVEDGARRSFVGQMVEREIGSFKDLTFDEAHRLIEWLEGDPDHVAVAVPPGPPQGWTSEQSDQLAADYLAALQAASTDADRAIIAKRIGVAVKAGKLTAADRETLLAAYTGRQPQPAGAPA